MKKKPQKIPFYRELSPEFVIATEILGLKSLHFGYWEKDEQLTLENLRKAQKRYTSFLLKQIPKNIKTILDVGAGMGDNAKALARRGYFVTAISPDIRHKQYYNTFKDKIDFQRTIFENFKSKKRFDLILMSESQNYFDPDIGFEQCRKYLQKGGYLLVSGKFKRKTNQRFPQVRNAERDFIQKARKYRLELIKRIDITEQTLPNIRFAKESYKKYIFPLEQMAYHYYQTNSSIKIKALLFILKILFWKRIKLLKIAIRNYRDHLDIRIFKRYVVYLVLLFRLDSE